MINNLKWPLLSNIIRGRAVSNTFGMVRKHKDGSPKPHQGWDFYAALGTPCFAIGDGKIVFADHRGDFGLIIVHSIAISGHTYYAAYAHLATSYVTVNQSVRQGETIALTGKSGNAQNLPARDMHLHFEIRTIPLPGVGLDGRISPLQVYGTCPLEHPIISPSLPAEERVNRGMVA